MGFDAEGFAVAHRIFAGNQGNGTSLISVLETLAGTIHPTAAKPVIESENYR